MNPQFFGRDKELEEAIEFLSRTIRGNGSLLIVLGNAGIGKTRFVEEFKSNARRTGCEVLTGRCLRGAATPYLPFIEAFSSYFDRNPFDIKLKDNADIPRSPKEVLFPTLDLVSRISSKNPLILHFEDVHWADSLTITLLHFLARSIGSLRVLIIATARKEELREGPVEQNHALDTIRMIRRENILHEIDLKPLGSEELGHIAESMLGAKLDARSIQRLQKITGGNPLFFIETLRFLQSKGSILRNNERWEIKKDAPIEIPLTVQDLILRRFEYLPQDQRRILEFASVAGEQFDPELMSKVFDLDRMQLLDSLDALSKSSGLIQETSEKYCFEHQIVQRVIYDNISSPFRREMHRRLGEAIEVAQNNEAELSMLADHFNFAGDAKKSMMYSMRAGESFLKGGAYNEAILYLTRAESLLQYWGGNEFEDRILEALGEANRESAQEEIADEYYQRRLSKDEISSRDRARILWKRAECWFPLNLGRGDASKCIALLDEAENCPDLAPLDRAEIELIRGVVSYMSYNRDDARVHYALASRLFRENGSMDRLIHCMEEEIEVRLSDGDITGAVKIFMEMDRCQHIKGSQLQRMSVEFVHGLIKWHMGDLVEALQHYANCLNICEKIGDFMMTNHTYQYSSLALMELGEYDAAEHNIKKALKQLEAFKVVTLNSRMCAYMAHFHLRKGELEEAKRYVSEASVSIEEYSSPLNITSGIVKLVEAELLVALGHDDIGQPEFLMALGLLRKSAYGIMFETIGLIWFADALRRQGHELEPRELLERARKNYQRLGNKNGAARLEILIHD